jgi:hypothetical protein
MHRLSQTGFVRSLESICETGVREHIRISERNALWLCVVESSRSQKSGTCLHRFINRPRWLTVWPGLPDRDLRLGSVQQRDPRQPVTDGLWDELRRTGHFCFSPVPDWGSVVPVIDPYSRCELVGRFPADLRTRKLNNSGTHYLFQSSTL